MSRPTRCWVTLVGATPLTGALPQLRAACDPAAVGGSMYGLRFLVYGAPVRVPSGQSAADKTRRRLLWEVSERDTGTTFDVEAMVAAHAAGQGS